ncbi:MAG: VOC family protein [Candidatus Eiseniibacteriota bacterium]|nr:MAG: VOC family protein [Candidatus Eisenbacteria bacterium]
MLRVTHFEIHADEPERAVEFYEKVFGWKIHKWQGPMEYWLVSTGPDGQPGINGGIMRREAGGTTYNTIDVPSVDEFIRKVGEAGGKVKAPKIAVPGVGYMAYCQDTEGNTFGIMEEDSSAK